MNLIETIKKFFRSKQLKKIPQSTQRDEYSMKVESIDDIDLIKKFEEKMPEKLKNDVEKYINEDIYNKELETKISREQLLDIAKSFFRNIDSEFSNKIIAILDGKDERFCLKIDPSLNGNNYVSNPNSIPISVNVTEYGDLRDLYGLIHELTHTLDIDNGDTSTRRILGEVAPQCMERLLDLYLLKNASALNLEEDALKQDINVRKYTTFISRARNVLNFNARIGDRVKDSRYALAQIYQAELVKNDFEQAKNKLVTFISCVNNDDFDGANKSIGMRIGKECKLRREIYINSAISEGENLFKKLNEEPNDISEVNIENIDLNNSFFHFTKKENLGQIMQEGLKPQIGDASKLKIEEKPRVYISKGGKGIIEIKNSFIHEFKQLKICEIPIEYRKYFSIKDYSSEEQISEELVYDAMEKNFKDELYFKVDAVENEDYLIENQFNEAFLEDFSIDSLRKMFDENPEKDIKGKADHTIGIGKLSLIKTSQGNTAYDITKYLYDRLLQNAKSMGAEENVRLANSDLDGFFEYIKNKEKEKEK